MNNPNKIWKNPLPDLNWKHIGDAYGGMEKD